MIIVLYPVSLHVLRINQFGNYLEIPLEYQHCSRVFMSSAIVSSWEQRDETPSSKPFKTIHDTLKILKTIDTSWALIIRLKLFLFRNSWTLSGPNLTIFPVPAGSLITFGYIPKSVSESVGSLHNMSTTSCY